MMTESATVHWRAREHTQMVDHRRSVAGFRTGVEDVKVGVGLL